MHKGFSNLGNVSMEFRSTRKVDVDLCTRPSICALFPICILTLSQLSFDYHLQSSKTFGQKFKNFSALIQKCFMILFADELSLSMRFPKTSQNFPRFVLNFSTMTCHTALYQNQLPKQPYLHLDEKVSREQGW